MKTYSPGRTPILHQFDDLFTEANITYYSPGQRLRVLAQYKTGTPRAAHVAFITDYLIYEVCLRFIAVQRSVNPHKVEDYKLAFKFERPDFAIAQRTNCLFVPMGECEPMHLRMLVANQDRDQFNFTAY